VDAAILLGGRSGKVDIALSIGEKHRKPERVLAETLVQSHDTFGLPTAIGNAKKALVIDAEKDLAPGAPGCAPLRTNRTKNLWIAARGRNLHQIPLGEESDPAAVRRPERLRGAFGPRQALEFGRVEAPQPKALARARAERDHGRFS